MFRNEHGTTGKMNTGEALETPRDKDKKKVLCTVLGYRKIKYIQQPNKAPASGPTKYLSNMTIKK